MSIHLEQQLIERVLNGERDLFRHFIENYQTMAYSIAISVLKNDRDTKDAVQNAFIRAFKSLRSFRQDSKFSSWFYKIVVNESLKQLKRQQSSSETVSFMNDAKDCGTVFNEALQNLMEEERNIKINKALGLMKPKEALVFKLYYLHEYKIDEVLEITGFSKSNIKVLLHRARKSFSALFVQ